MNATTSQPAAAPSSAAAPRRGAWATRATVVAIVLLLTAAAIGKVVPWARYRFNNVVLREAAVRGTVNKIGARMDGRVATIEVEPGQPVSKGDVLLRMEASHLNAALQKARGELTSETRELETEKLAIEQARRRLTLEIERGKGSLKKAKGELQAQQSSLLRLEKQYERIAKLLETGAAARADMDKITGDRDRALGMLNAASAVVEMAQSSHDRSVAELDGLAVRENRLGVLEARIAVARAEVASAEADLEAAVVRAPDNGRVLETLIQAGGSAKVGEPILALWTGRPWIEAWANERALQDIRINSAVDVSFDAAPDRKLVGRVHSIGLATDKQMQPAPFPSTLHAFSRPNAMVPIRIELEDENAPLQLGLSVLVGIRKEETNVARSAKQLRRSAATAPDPRITKISE